jgi:hypothetical protein
MEEPSLVTPGCAYAPDTRRELIEWLTSYSRVKTQGLQEDPDIGVSADPSTESILLMHGTCEPGEPMASVLWDRILMECGYSECSSLLRRQDGHTYSLDIRKTCSGFCAIVHSQRASVGLSHTPNASTRFGAISQSTFSWKCSRYAPPLSPALPVPWKS